MFHNYSSRNSLTVSDLELTRERGKNRIFSRDDAADNAFAGLAPVFSQPLNATYRCG